VTLVISWVSGKAATGLRAEYELAFLAPFVQYFFAMQKITSKKLIALASALAVLATFAAPALRAEDAPKKKEPSKKQLEMWDKNHDGKLDDEEMAAMRAAKKKKDGGEAKKEEKAPEKK